MCLSRQASSHIYKSLDIVTGRHYYPLIPVTRRNNMKNKMVVERFKNFDVIVPRIGRSTQERLEWVVDLVQRKEELTPGDRENLRLELAALIELGRPLPSWYLQRLRRHIGKLPKSALEPVPNS